MHTTLLIFPHQLFKEHSGLLASPDQIELVEDSLFFCDTQYPVNFHKQKLLLHRASMRAYAAHLAQLGFDVNYRNWHPGVLDDTLKRLRKRRVLVMDPVDNVLSRRLHRAAADMSIQLEILPSQLFINTSADNRLYRSSRKRWFMADYYKWQRLRLNVMVKDAKPVGGKWSYDEQNRRKIPAKARPQIPEINFADENTWTDEARQYVTHTFPNALGGIEQNYYPVTFDGAERWLDEFLCQRFANFGTYEDALVPSMGWLYHGVLTPMLNIGLLTPWQIVSAAIDYADANDIPINSLEGFVRQIIGWREFMRATYEDLGVAMRTTNHWRHQRPMPRSFYTAETGIQPIDDVIGRVLDTGYCHHIERLMVLGGFMFLCEIEPDAIYRWFMELFIDAYDWVMVPNVYGMSQNADGGLITTKPYFSGSAYLRKMGYDQTGEWCDIWDGLYWRWIWNHQEELEKNPRWAMMCSMARKMDSDKMANHIKRAETFLAKL